MAQAWVSASAAHFVELLGGNIQAESTLGRGSRFRVELPAQIAEADEFTAQSASAEQVIGLESRQSDYRILIVEDQRENWLLLQRLLQTIGFQIRVAEDGGQAVESFISWRPHFIWMDVRLPVLSGLEAADTFANSKAVMKLRSLQLRPRPSLPSARR